MSSILSWTAPVWDVSLADVGRALGQAAAHGAIVGFAYTATVEGAVTFLTASALATLVSVVVTPAFKWISDSATASLTRRIVVIAFVGWQFRLDPMPTLLFNLLLWCISREDSRSTKRIETALFLPLTLSPILK